MDYTETEASRMLKKYNDTLYETLRKAKGDVRDSFQQTLSTINQTIDDYAHKRAEEIAVERTQPVMLPNGRIITKGSFIDTQRKYELDDEETTNYIMMRWYDNLC